MSCKGVRVVKFTMDCMSVLAASTCTADMLPNSYCSVSLTDTTPVERETHIALFCSDAKIHNSTVMQPDTMVAQKKRRRRRKRSL